LSRKEFVEKWQKELDEAIDYGPSDNYYQVVAWEMNSNKSPFGMHPAEERYYEEIERADMAAEHFEGTLEEYRQWQKDGHEALMAERRAGWDPNP